MTRRRTATGMPRTRLGYYLRQLACRLGIHDRMRYIEDGFLVDYCVNSECHWGES